MNTPDDDLRQLFSDATSDIRPQGSLDDILNRTKKVDPMARRWFLPVIAAAAVMAFVIGGAVWIANDSNTPKGGNDVSNTPKPTTGIATVERAVPMYFVGDAAEGKRLFREFQKQQTCASTDCLLITAVTRSLGGGQTDPDYKSLWPDDVEVTGTAFSTDLITIDLSADAHDRPAGMSAEDAELAIQQAIYTAQAAVGKGRLPVKFTIDGGPTDTVLGVPTSEPLAAGDEVDVLAPVQISNPTDGATVKAGTVKIEGIAATFEANVVWEILVGGDAVAKNGHTTAAECCKLTPYSFTVDLEPGTYTIVVHDSDESGEGRPVNQDTKEIVVE